MQKAARELAGARRLPPHRAGTAGTPRHWGLHRGRGCVHRLRRTGTRRGRQRAARARPPLRGPRAHRRAGNQAPRRRGTARRARNAARADVGAFNQALMDLGASVCVPNGRAALRVLPDRRAVRSPPPRRGTGPAAKSARKNPAAWRTAPCSPLCGRAASALRKRPPRGLLAGMWELPSVDGALDERQAREALRAWGVDAPPQRLPDARHVFTHVEWRMRVYRAEGRADGLFLGHKGRTRPRLRAAFGVPED